MCIPNEGRQDILKKGALHLLVWGRSPGGMAFLVRVDLIYGCWSGKEVKCKLARRSPYAGCFVATKTQSE